MKIIFLGFSCMLNPGLLEGTLCSYPSAPLAAHWGEQEVPHQRRRLQRLHRAQATAAHLDEPHSWLPAHTGKVLCAHKKGLAL